MLQKEVARLEAERRIPENAAIEYSTIQALLIAKEAEIQQVWMCCIWQIRMVCDYEMSLYMFENEFCD